MAQGGRRGRHQDGKRPVRRRTSSLVVDVCYFRHDLLSTVLSFLMSFITGPPNGPVLFCSLASVVCRHRLLWSVTLLAGCVGGQRAEHVGGRAADTARRASTVTSRSGDTLF